VIQQKTVNDIREAIKPQPRPVHTNLYVPPKPNAIPGVIPSGDDGVQVVEIVEGKQPTKDAVGVSPENAVVQPVAEEEEEGLVQGADGGFLRKQTQRQRRPKGLLDKILAADSRRGSYEESNRDGSSNPRKSAEASGGSTPGSGDRLSRAARRKSIKDEFVKLAGEDVLNNPNAYKKRRMW
jgi:hypothetical protein